MVASGVAAQPGMQSFNTRDCPEQASVTWCRPKLEAEGWRLKYQSKAQIHDKAWQYDVWLRGDTAMLCIAHYSGRGGPNFSFCQPLNEVTQ
jgi:hypothetical protein